MFQRLPKKMRRRVMSTTVKRMPRDLQAAHTKSVLKTIFNFNLISFECSFNIYLNYDVD